MIFDIWMRVIEGRQERGPPRRLCHPSQVASYRHLTDEHIPLDSPQHTVSSLDIICRGLHVLAPIIYSPPRFARLILTNYERSPPSPPLGSFPPDAQHLLILNRTLLRCLLQREEPRPLKRQLAGRLRSPHSPKSPRSL